MAGSRIEGLGELRATFSRLGNEMKTIAARRIVAKGAGVLKKEARAIAQAKGLRKTGALINNIVVKREKTPDGLVQYNLGVRHGKELGKKYKHLTLGKNGHIRVDYKNNPFYWIFLEFGHKIVPRRGNQQGGGLTVSTVTNKNGKVFNRARKWSAASITGRRRNATGFVDATPFIGPALVNKRHEALAAMEAQAKKELERAGK